MIKQELDADMRVVALNSSFIGIAPYASRFPYELIILPIRHSLYFESITDKDIQMLSELLSEIFKKIDSGLSFPPFNMLLHNYISNVDDVPYYHWHIELFPRLSNVAGFEWGTGFYINPVPPEKAAEELKNASIV